MNEKNRTTYIYCTALYCTYEGGGSQEVFFALIFLGTKSRNSCNRDGDYEWVGMKNGSIRYLLWGFMKGWASRTAQL